MVVAQPGRATQRHQRVARVGTLCQNFVGQPLRLGDGMTARIAFGIEPGVIPICLRQHDLRAEIVRVDLQRVAQEVAGAAHVGLGPAKVMTISDHVSFPSRKACRLAVPQPREVARGQFDLHRHGDLTRDLVLQREDAVRAAVEAP
jgi:hypothetical protein